MFEFSPIPERFIDKAFDAVIDILSKKIEKLPKGASIAHGLRELHSKADSRRQFHRALEVAIERFKKEYEVIDEDLVTVITGDNSFLMDEDVQGALINILKNPDKYLENDQEVVQLHFQAVFPDRKNRDRVDRAIGFFLQCLAKSVWLLDEYRDIYNAVFNKESIENIRKLTLIGEHQLQIGETQVKELQSLREIVLQLTEAITYQKQLTAGGLGVALLNSPKADTGKSILVEAHLDNFLSEMPSVYGFHGRTQELDLMDKWALSNKCRLVSIVGLGGIGKSAFTAKFVQRVQDSFEFVIWRSLRNAPPLRDLLDDIIQLLSNQPSTSSAEDQNKQLAKLTDLFQSHRCLLVLDNFESILKKGKKSSAYIEGYDGYGTLLERLGETEHNSLLLLTSREKPREFSMLEKDMDHVRSLKLYGLDLNEGRKILRDYAISGTDDEGTSLISQYEGNPLALKLVASTINDLFGGKISEFLKRGLIVFGDIRDVLDQQFDRLSELEKQIVYWLALEREAVSLDVIQNNFVYPHTVGELVETIRSLQRKSLIELGGKYNLFTLQNVVMEYATEEFLKIVQDEFLSENLNLFISHGLIKAHASDYIRNSQIRLILRPFAERIISKIGLPEFVAKTQKLITENQMYHPGTPGYFAGNVLNILVELGVDLTGWNLSNLVIWEAYLSKVELRKVDFSNSDLSRAEFIDTFGAVLTVAYNPTGSKFAVGSANGEVRIWDTNKLKQLFALHKHTNWVRSLSFSPTGDLLASASDDHTIQLWDANNGEHIKTLVQHTSRILTIDFNHEGNLLLSAGDDNLAKLWDTQSGECIQTFEGHTNWIWGARFSPDGKLIATASHDHTVRLWDSNSGICLKTLVGHTHKVASVAFNFDGSLLASASSDHTIMIWDVLTGECIHILKGHTNWVWAIAFGHQSNILASAGDDQTVRIWDLTNLSNHIISQGSAGLVRCMDISPDDQVVLTGCEEQIVQMWNSNTGLCLKTLRGFANRVRSVSFNPNQNILASGSTDGIVRLWDIAQDNSRELRGHTNRIRRVVFSNSGAFLASSSIDQTIRLWDITSGKCIKTLSGHSGPVRSVSFSPNDELIASGGEDQTIRVWRRLTGECVEILSGHTDRVWSVVFIDDATLASGAGDNTIRFWNILSGTCSFISGIHNKPVRCLSFSKEYKILASGGDDHKVVLSDMGGQQIATFDEHAGPVWAVAFSKNSGLLASAGSDKTIRLWDLATKKCVKTLYGHKSWVVSVSFNSEDNVLASSSDDETINLWSLNSFNVIKTLQSPGPYQAMNIKDAIGLNESQKQTLSILGAIIE